MDLSNVPFGNSAFQIINFTDGKETPYRRYRHCILQLNQKLHIIKECEFRRKRCNIDIEELREKIEVAKSFEKQRFEIDFEEKKYQLDIEIKLIEDCLIEIAVYKQILKDLPDFTREEFEQAEQEYWEKRLINDAQNDLLSSGSISSQIINSLRNIGIEIKRDQKNHIIFTKNKQEEIEDKRN